MSAASVSASPSASPARPACAPARARRWLGLAFAFSPAVVLGLLMKANAVNVPTWDDWERAPLIEKWEAGELTFKDLYAPHIEHRILFPRLITLGLNAVSGGDLRAEMGFIFLTKVLTGVAVFLLLGRSLGPRSRLLVPAAFVINLMLFSPLQWQNLLWGIQVAFMLPMCCIAWSLVVLGTRRLGLAAGVDICLALALVGTHSFGHGMLIWPVVMLGILCSTERLGGRRWLFGGAWALCAVLVLGAYFNPATFQNVSHPSHAYMQPVGGEPPASAHLDAALEKGGEIVEFVLVMLGNQFSRAVDLEPVDWAGRVGAVLLAVFFLLALRYLLGIRRRPDLWQAALPWLALGGVAIVTCFMVSLGRSGVMGLIRSLTPRYLSMTLYLGVALVPLVLLRARALLARPGFSRLRPGAGHAFTAAVAAFAMLQGFYWLYGAQRMDRHRQARLHARTDLLLINFFEPDRVDRLDATCAFARESANRLNALGLLDPPLFENRRLDNFKPSRSPLSSSRGEFRLARVAPAGSDAGDAGVDPPRFRAEGFAELPRMDGEHAHGVLLVAENAAGEREIFAVASVYGPPKDFFHYHDHEFDAFENPGPHRWSAWSKEFSAADLPEGGPDPARVEAWAAKSSDMRAWRVREVYRIDRGTGRVERVETGDR